jgi:hypothetical protein
MLRVIRGAHEAMELAIGRGIAIEALVDAPALLEISRMRAWPEDGAAELADSLVERIRAELETL